METKEKTKKVTTPKWEIKDRFYYLLAMSPLSYTMNSKHTSRSPLLYFDETKMEQRALRYATNQSSPFVDEQDGQVTLEHIVFKDGTLHVPKEKQNLQKMLSLYHPLLNKKYAEQDSIMEAETDLEDIELEVHALNAALSIDLEQAEAILRVEKGSKVSGLDSREIKRDILIFAKKNPKLFIDLANDENVILRNFAIKAVELGIINIASDQRTFTWGANGRKLINVPFEENAYSALAAWFKTDEGLEVYKSVEKKMN